MVPSKNPLEPREELKQPQPGEESISNPQQQILPGDSATTKAEKVERHGGIEAIEANGEGETDFHESPNKRVKLDHRSEPLLEPFARQKGITPIKKEYLVDVKDVRADSRAQYDDDAAESSGKGQPEHTAGRGGQKTKGGMNTARTFGSSRDALQLCRSVVLSNEFSPAECNFGSKCKHEHNLRKYLKEGKREDLHTFGDSCPVFEARGKCNAGWKCRFVSSHSTEIEHADGRKELVLLSKEDAKAESNGHSASDATSGDANGKHVNEQDDDLAYGAVNVISNDAKITLKKKKHPTPRSDTYLHWLSKQKTETDGRNAYSSSYAKGNGEKDDHRAEYIEPPPRPSEKRRIYYGPETPVLAPLTTQGNLPYRRLCVELGAQVTWSEMAMGLPLISGEKQEWALMKAHASEATPPAYFPKNPVKEYDNSKDIKFGAQIAGNKPWLAVKTTEVLSDLCPQLRAIDLNCGCPIDLVFRQGAGSALLDSQGKLEKILRGMNTVSKEVPITVKIRMGTKDKSPNADKLCQKLIQGGLDTDGEELDPAGVAAITLHGRSRQQRYTRSADWEYIAECASLVKKLKAQHADATDTIREPEARDLPATNNGLPYFCGNGDILCHEDYNAHIENAGVDSIMIGRGALVKPWIFEEISSNQYLDKSATERLIYVERFCRNGLEYWGSDEIGVGTTRRFLLEWLSFSCRYVPIGLLEYLPPKFGDRPPAFRGRSDLETLLSSANYKDWIKISEMFLGPAHKDFNFQPKHKSNSYEIEAEG